MPDDIYHRQVLAEGLLPASQTALYNCPMRKRAKIETITLVNTDGSARTVNLYIKSAAGGTTARRIIPSAQSIPAGGMLADDEIHSLSDGASLEGDASVADVVSYVVEGEESE